MWLLLISTPPPPTFVVVVVGVGVVIIPSSSTDTTMMSTIFAPAVRVNGTIHMVVTSGRDPTITSTSCCASMGGRRVLSGRRGLLVHRHWKVPDDIPVTVATISHSLPSVPSSSTDVDVVSFSD
jgi:hypothetical protein